MSGTQSVMISGKLARAPEIRTTSGGRLVATLEVPTIEAWSGRDFTTWHKIVVWEPLAQRCQRLTKGSAVFIVGKIRHRTWKDRNGVPHKSWEVVAEALNGEGADADEETDTDSEKT